MCLEGLKEPGTDRSETECGFLFVGTVITLVDNYRLVDNSLLIKLEIIYSLKIKASR